MEHTNNTDSQNSKPVLNRYALYTLIRDASSVSGVPLLLLHAIAWRCNPSAGYICYPSLPRLAQDIHCSKRGVQLAAARLEECGYITRERRFNHATIYTLQVARLQEELTQSRQPRDSSSKQPKVPVRPTEPEDNRDSDLEPTSRDELEVAGGDCVDLSDVIQAVQFIWPTHPIWLDSEAEDLLAGPLLECIEMADSPTLCGYVLVETGRDPKIHQAVQQSKLLGPYIRKCFPQWLKAYNAFESENEQESNHEHIAA